MKRGKVAGSYVEFGAPGGFVRYSNARPTPNQQRLFKIAEKLVTALVNDEPADAFTAAAASIGVGVRLDLSDGRTV